MVNTAQYFPQGKESSARAIVRAVILEEVSYEWAIIHYFKQPGVGGAEDEE